MKSPRILYLLLAAAVAVTSGLAQAQASVSIQAPPKPPTPTKTPPPTATLPKPTDPITRACPVAVMFTSLNGTDTATLAGDATWHVKALVKPDAKAFQVRREGGGTSDVLWCDYRDASTENGAAWMQMSTASQAPLDHPKCAVNQGQMSFTCRVLGSGESY